MMKNTLQIAITVVDIFSSFGTDISEQRGVKALRACTNGLIGWQALIG